MMMKVMTLNMDSHVKDHGSWAAHQKRLVDVIRMARPDIVAFQSFRRNPLLEQGVVDAYPISRAMARYPYVLFETGDSHNNGNSNGSALFSRVPAAGAVTVRLSLGPRTEDPNQRLVLHAMIPTAHSPLNIYNAHFSWIPAQAESNLKETLSYVSSFPGPGLLVGDLNAEPGSEIVERLAGAGWTDLWARLHPREPGYTSTLPAVKRIDYAWANAELGPYVQGIDLLVGDDEPSVQGHRGLLVTLLMEVISDSGAFQ